MGDYKGVIVMECSFCTARLRETLLSSDDMNDIVWIDENKLRLEISSDAEWHYDFGSKQPKDPAKTKMFFKEINYCPICGRKLNV